jgi:hypothetical protein
MAPAVVLAALMDPVVAPINLVIEELIKDKIIQKYRLAKWKKL